VAGGIRTIVTEPMEQAAEAVQRQLKPSGVPITEVEMNAFRSPMLMFQRDVNFPCYDNAFWYAIHCQE
jgi:hypothetical protein